MSRIGNSYPGQWGDAPTQFAELEDEPEGNAIAGLLWALTLSAAAVGAGVLIAYLIRG